MEEFASKLFLSWGRFRWQGCPFIPKLVRNPKCLLLYIVHWGWGGADLPCWDLLIMFILWCLLFYTSINRSGLLCASSAAVVCKFCFSFDGSADHTAEFTVSCLIWISRILHLILVLSILIKVMFLRVTCCRCWCPLSWFMPVCLSDMGFVVSSKQVSTRQAYMLQWSLKYQSYHLTPGFIEEAII
jgi:hypothetical protein